MVNCGTRTEFYGELGVSYREVCYFRKVDMYVIKCIVREIMK
jgi:hypothetical protein